MHDMLEQGRVKKAKDLEELSQMTGMPLNHLKASIEEYNRAARHEVEADKFGFKATHTDDRPMTEGPWYFAKKVPTIHHTMGGIKIDTNAHVLNAKGQWIKGLYAAGETTGGVHGENRLGGNAVADLMVFGRTAGRNAANAK
jgi:succinate dehydrogenase/fumarate reductase flavoprotein subunit